MNLKIFSMIKNKVFVFIVSDKMRIALIYKTKNIKN